MNHNMNKYLCIILSIIVLIILLVIGYRFFINPVEAVSEKNGRFYDTTGKQLGYYTVKTVLRK